MKTGKDGEGRDTKWMLTACGLITVIGGAVLVRFSVYPPAGFGSSPSDVTVTFVMSEYDATCAARASDPGKEKLTLRAHHATSLPVYIGFMGVETNGPSAWVSDRDAYMWEIMRPMKKLNPATLASCPCWCRCHGPSLLSVGGCAS